MKFEVGCKLGTQIGPAVGPQFLTRVCKRGKGTRFRPFDLDYFELWITLSDILVEVYQKMIAFISGSSPGGGGGSGGGSGGISSSGGNGNNGGGSNGGGI
ncbi:hypothetical protein PCASD_07171 [Puccinia coronata f. sp. avenae]|uniref:Uncharacterized protein n=1 Tax=Puccinia coronata f. sp. avenae TaxID=200324 RepID=A0A2N5UUZ7_9BASI|nr:hypothetical protein PCASD_07171 [Puccinia coronata f. sp. avenae]